MIPKKIARARLLALWSLSGLLLICLMIARTIGNKFGHLTNDAWSWFLPTILPTLSLMISVSIAQQADDLQSSTFLYRLAFLLSVFYLVLVLFTILNPVEDQFQNPLELMKLSNLWLGPVQGLVAATLGVFFVRDK